MDSLPEALRNYIPSSVVPLPFESLNKIEHFNPNREKELEEKEKPFRSNIQKRKIIKK